MKTKTAAQVAKTLTLLALLQSLAGESLHAAAFTAGDLAIVQAAANANNTTCSVIEINTTTAAQTAVQTIPIDGSTNRVSGSATSTLYAADNNDGSLLCFTAHNNSSTSANANTLNPREVIALDASGNYSRQAIYNGSSGNQARGASSLNNSTWYAGDQGGIYTNGSSLLLSGNLRGVKCFGGIIYVFTASTTFTAPVLTVSADGRTGAPLPGLPATVAANQDFYLISSGNNGNAYDVLYLLSATSGTVGTISKYSLVSGTWTANGSYATSFGGFGLCAAKGGSGAVLYVTTGTGATVNNSVVKLTDTAGYNSTIAITTANNVTLFTTSGSAILKGIAFAPASSLALDNTGTPIAGSIITGTANVPLFGFQLTPSGTVDFTGLKLTTAGSATTSDLSNFRVVYDADNSGAYNVGDTIVSASAPSLANPINFSITGQTGISGAHRYLVIADVAPGAIVGDTFTASIAAAGDVTASISANGTAAGNLQTIAAAVSDLTMSAVAGSESATISSLANNATIADTNQAPQVWAVTFSNPAGNAGAGTITAINLTQGANNGVANWQNTIQSAELFDGNTPIGAGIVSATNISFAGLNLAIADNAAKTITLHLTVQAAYKALADHAGFQFALTGPNVTIAGNNIVTAAINSDSSQNIISVVATKLAFTSVPTVVMTNKAFVVNVEAEDANGNVDLDDTDSVTISLASGAGILAGGDALSLVNGTNRWVNLSLDTAGTFSLSASGGSLASATSSNIIARLQPSLAEVILPQFIQGGLSSNSKRLPYAYCVTLSNLAPNATYRYYNQVVIASDSATSDGAGNILFASATGSFGKTSSPSLGTAGGYGTFATDANGSYTGWFISEPTGNAGKFATAGTQDYMRIMLNDGANGTSVFARVTTPDAVTVLAFGTTSAGGTGISGSSAAADKNFVVLYDNTAGTGRPLAATLVEDDGQAENTAASYVKFYNDSVDGVSGAWGAIIPNSNASGVQRIEQRSITGNNLVGFNTDGDGVWPSGANTVNPTGGDATPLVLTAADAPLNSTGSVTTPVIINIQVTGGNVLIDFTGGASDLPANFTVLGTTDLTTAFTSATATVTSTGPGLFRATIAAGADPMMFYRIQR